MASDFKIGVTSGGITSLDALGTPVPDPQHQFREFLEMERLGNMKLRGSGPNTLIWKFPLLEVNELAMLETFVSTDPIYIRSPKRDDIFGIFEALMNIPIPAQDGEHMPGFRGYRGGYEIEFVILSEVV